MIDVTDWEAASEEQLGTKPKQWLRDPHGELWLWKPATWNRTANGAEYLKGDHWAERIACSIARELGVPAAHAELATRIARPGTVCRTVLDDDDVLVHGNELLAEAGIVVADSHDRLGYTLDAVADVLARVDPPVEHPALGTAYEWFVGFLTLDACIGNTDRHQENWAVIERDGTRRLAPSFDHASSLGFLLSDDERVERLQTRDLLRTPERWAASARSRFEDNPGPVDLAVDGLLMVGRPARLHWLDSARGLRDLNASLSDVPAAVMSEPAREFARRVFASNVERLMSHRGLRVQS